MRPAPRVRRAVAAVAALGACALVHLASAAPADAQPTRPNGAAAPADLARARELFQQGVALVGQERWGEALEFFQRSRALVERPSTVFNIGSALIRLGRVNDAIPVLEEFLRISDPRANASERDEAQRLLEQARAAGTRLTLELNTPDARVEVDGVARPGTGRERVITLNPGSHRVRVSAEGFEDEAFDASLLPAQLASRRVELRERPTQLRLDTTPTRAAVRVDGVVVGADERVVNVAPGAHEIEVSAPGHRALRRRATVRRGQQLQLQLALARDSVFVSPGFWIVAGLVVVAGVTIAAVCIPGDGPCRTDLPPYGGSTGRVLMGATLDPSR